MSAVRMQALQLNDRNLQLSTQNLVRVLLIDDEKPFRNGLKNILEEWGCAVVDVAGPTEALPMLSEGSYQVIIVDMMFDESESISGDEFIIRNKNMMRNAEVIAITGKPLGKITHLERLRELKVRVLEKGDHIAALTAAMEEQKQDLTKRIERSLNVLVYEDENKASFRLLQLVEQMLIGWLKSRSNPDKPGIIYKGKMYSANDLVVEIERGSEVGQIHLEMLVNLIKHTLHL